MRRKKRNEYFKLGKCTFIILFYFLILVFVGQVNSIYEYMVEIDC